MTKVNELWNGLTKTKKIMAIGAALLIVLAVVYIAGCATGCAM